MEEGSEEGAYTWICSKVFYLSTRGWGHQDPLERIHKIKRPSFFLKRLGLAAKAINLQ